MIKVAICDDDVFYPRHMEEIILASLHKVGEFATVEKHDSGERLLDAIIRQGRIYDVIFIDIEMPGMNGIETVEKIRDIDKSVRIVFVSAHRSYAEIGYGKKKDAFAFISKEYLASRLDETILDILRDMNYFDMIERDISFKRKVPSALTDRTHQYSSFIVKEKDIMQLYKKSKITSVRSVMLETTSEEYTLLTDSLEKYLRLINSENFYRVNRSHTINMHNIKKFQGDIITLKNDKEISLGLNTVTNYKFKQAYNKFREGRAR